MGARFGLGGTLGSSRTIVEGSGTIPGFIPGWVGCVVGWWVPPFGWEGRWDSPGRLLMGVRDGTGIFGGLGIVWLGW